MTIVIALFGTVLLICFSVSLVQAHTEAKREGRPVLPALLERTLLVFIQLWV